MPARHRLVRHGHGSSGGSLLASLSFGVGDRLCCPAEARDKVFADPRIPATPGFHLHVDCDKRFVGHPSGAASAGRGRQSASGLLGNLSRLLDTGATIESLPEADCTESFLTEQARHGCASTRPAPWAALFGSTGCHHLPPSDAHCSHDKVSELPARSLCQRFAAKSIQEGTHRIKTHRTNIII